MLTLSRENRVERDVVRNVIMPRLRRPIANYIAGPSECQRHNKHFWRDAAFSVRWLVEYGILWLSEESQRRELFYTRNHALSCEV